MLLPGTGGGAVPPRGSLIVLAGPFGVGQSTWAARLFGAADILCADDERGQLTGSQSDLTADDRVFSLVYETAAGRLAAGASVDR